MRTVVTMNLDMLIAAGIMYRCDDGAVRTVKWALDNGADVDARNENGWTALMLAAKHVRKKCLTLLLDRGADVNARNDDGRTPLMVVATETLIPEFMTILLDQGADINALDDDGYTALMFIAARGSAECVELLLDRGADINAQDVCGKTALMQIMLTAYRIRTECVELLMDRGADVLVRNLHGQTALMMLRDPSDNPTIVSEIVEAGDRSWDSVPAPCPGLEKALLSVFRAAPSDLAQWFRRLTPEVQEVVRTTLRVLHDRVKEEAVRIEILARVLY